MNILLQSANLILTFPLTEFCAPATSVRDLLHFSRVWDYGSLLAIYER